MSFPAFENRGGSRRSRSHSRGRSMSGRSMSHGRSLSRQSSRHHGMDDEYDDDEDDDGDEEDDYSNDLVDHGFRDDRYAGDGSVYGRDAFQGGIPRRGASYAGTAHTDPMMSSRNHGQSYDTYDRHGMAGSSMQRGRSSYGGEDMYMNGMQPNSPMSMGMQARDPYYNNNQQLAIMPPQMDPYSNMQPGGLSRRRSSVSFAAQPHIMQPSQQMNGGAFNRPGSGMVIKFRRKGSFGSGVNLADANSYSLKLAKRDAYSPYMLHLDPMGYFHLFIQIAGVPNGTYKVSMDPRDGRLSLTRLARQISRAFIHYCEANRIPTVLDRMVLHEMREIGYGVWQPMITSRR